MIFDRILEEEYEIFKKSNTKTIWISVMIFIGVLFLLIGIDDIRRLMLVITFIKDILI